MSQTELTTRVARLFYTAGLLHDEEIKAYDARNSKQKSLMQVFKQDVSLSTFMDLMTVEIGFSASKSDGAGLHEGLSATNLVNDDELLQLFALHRPAPDALIAPLIRDGLLKAVEFQPLLERALSREEDVYAWLVRDGHVTAEKICKWLENPKSRAVNRAALSLSLYLLQRNAKLDEIAYRRAIEVLADGDSTVAQLAQALGEISDSQLMSVLEGDVALPQINLAQASIDSEWFARFPQSFIRRQLIVPIDAGDLSLKLATSDPLNVGLCAFLFWVTGRWPQPSFAPARQVIETINGIYAPAANSDGDGQPVLNRRASDQPRAPLANAQTFDQAAGESAPVRVAPVSGTPVSPRASSRERDIADGDAPMDQTSAVQLVSSIIENAIGLRTTDIHLEPGTDSMKVRFRVDGDLHKIMTVPASLVQSVTSRIKVLGNLNVTERRRPQDGHFELKSADNHYDFRISTLPVNTGEKIVIRILESSRVITGLDGIGLLPEQQATVEKFVKNPNGMILVTGPTGSGKTSTLYAALSVINNENRNLVTIEDPVEYQLPGINQVQVDASVNLTFSEGLRSILRQDPDVIMVGEIRDADTARIAIRAALTGHLVFSTLHTNSALGAIEALMGLGAVPFMIANSLVGIVSQRLVRLLCMDCRQPQKINKLTAMQLGLPEKTKKQIYVPKGCPKCLNTGYRGRSGIFEVIGVDEKVRNAIAHYETPEELEKIVLERGMIPLREAGARKVVDGLTSIDEVTKHVLLDV